MNSILRVRYAFVLCGWLALAGTANAVVSDAPTASQPPSPSGAKASGPQQTNPSKPDDETQNPKTSTGQPVTVNVFSPQATQSTTGQKAEQSHEESPWKGVWEALIAIATVALAFITGILAWYTYKLWDESSKARVKATEDGLLSRKETRETLGIAKESADTAKATLVASEANAKRQLRAYVNVFKVFASWHADESDKLRPITITVENKNAGQTPAYRVAGWINSISSKGEPSCFPQPSEGRQPQSVGVQAPGQISHFQATRTLILDAESEITIWQRGFESLYVWGEIEYIDAFNVRQETKFRYVMTREGMHAEGGKFMSCAEGNEAT